LYINSFINATFLLFEVTESLFISIKNERLEGEENEVFIDIENIPSLVSDISQIEIFKISLLESHSPTSLKKFHHLAKRLISIYGFFDKKSCHKTLISKPLPYGSFHTFNEGKYIF